VSIAGSFGIPRGGGSTFFAASSTLRSFTSEPRKTMNSKTLSDGGTSSFPRRPSVPYDRTAISLFLGKCDLTYLVQEQRWILQSLFHEGCLHIGYRILI